jgi:hypothetical protein
MKRKEPEQGSAQSSDTTAGVPEPDQMVSGDAGTDRENNDEQADGKAGTSSRQVERMTGLRGLSIGNRRVAPSTIRARTEGDLRQSDAEIPYLKTEKAIRDLVCSLMERQDRMNEDIFLKLNNLEYRVDDVEQGRKPWVTKRSCADKEGRK